MISHPHPLVQTVRKLKQAYSVTFWFEPETQKIILMDKPEYLLKRQCVYSLWYTDACLPFYIGQTARLLTRIKEHVYAQSGPTEHWRLKQFHDIMYKTKKPIRCYFSVDFSSRNQAKLLEREYIRQFGLWVYNVQSNPYADEPILH